MQLRALSSLLLATCLAHSAPGQGTAPRWGSYFGAPGFDAGTAIARGPGDQVTIVGHALTSGLYGAGGLATPGAFQVVNGGAASGGRTLDVFIARFDPTLPPGQQLLWCTYFGREGHEVALDVEVDPGSGLITVVGCSDSTLLPAVNGQPAPAVNGPSDGFVAQITQQPGPSGGLVPVLQSCMSFGGADDDRICDVEIDAGSGMVTVAGVTESPSSALGSLPNTGGTVSATYRGGPTDAFVAKLIPSVSATAWATYIGGSAAEGLAYASWDLFSGSPALNLERIALAVDRAGNIGVATSCSAPPSCPGQGFEDVYLAVLSPNGSSLIGQACFGGSHLDRPHALGVHPSGGFVIGGYTTSVTTGSSQGIPVTAGSYQASNRRGSFGLPADGFLCWIDPAAASPLRYATYLGGGGGEDAVFDLQIESSGVVTVCGMAAGGGAIPFPATVRSLQPALSAQQLGGMVARLEMAGQGARDLHYATFVGTQHTVVPGLALDDFGDAWLVGRTSSGFWPTTSSLQPGSAGQREAAILHLPLLAGCVSRRDIADAATACGASPHTDLAGVPLPGQTFELRATGAPAGALGALVLGLAPTRTPLPSPGAWLLVQPTVTATLPTNALGAASVPITVPAALNPACPWGLHAQWLFLCPNANAIAGTERLAF